MEYDAQRDRTCCDLGLWMNRVTDNKFAERVLGFMMRASLRRSLNEQLDILTVQWKHIKRDKPLANELIDSSRRELQHFLTLNSTFAKLQKITSKGLGARTIAGLFSKDNITMLREEEPDEKEQLRRDVVIESYEKTITILRQKKETFLVAEACSELGNFLWFCNQKEKASALWKDGTDAVLRTLDSLKYYRSVFDRTPNMLESFGFWGSLVASMLLTRSAYLTYAQDLYLRNEACTMAVALVTATFTCSLPHPQRSCDFRKYVPRESWPGMFPLDLFENPYVMYPVVLMESLEYMNHGVMRSRLYIEVTICLSITLCFLMLASCLVGCRLCPHCPCGHLWPPASLRTTSGAFWPGCSRPSAVCNVDTLQKLWQSSCRSSEARACLTSVSGPRASRSRWTATQQQQWNLLNS